MISSKYISDILDLLLDGDDLGTSARSQIDYLADERYEYTGVGAFVSFKQLPGIEKHRLTTDRVILNGLEIESTLLEIGAEASVFIDGGLIEYLEIWSYSGEYPSRELTDYTLKQSWTNGEGREIVVK